MCSQNLSTAVKSMLVQSPKISTTVQNNSTNAFTVFTAFCISVNIFIVVLQRLQSMILCLLFFLAASPEHAAEGKHNWTSHQHQGVRHRSQAWRKVKIMAPWWSNRGVLSRDVHADVFSDAHQCVCRIYPTYVGYSAILLDNAEVDADIRIRMAIPILDCDLVIIIFDLLSRMGPKSIFFVLSELCIDCSNAKISTDTSLLHVG